MPPDLPIDFGEIEMGGFMSGRSGTREHRLSVKHVPSIDIRALERDPYWRAGAPVSFTWRDSRGRSYTVTVFREEGELQIDEVGLYGHIVRRQAVQLDRMECHLGGSRLWMRCPNEDCGRRAAILYARSSFACRKCQGLAYYSQRTTAWSRSLEKAQRIRERLGGSANMTLPFPERPKGMHQMTYNRLFFLHADAEQMSYPAGLLKFAEKMRRRRRNK